MEKYWPPHPLRLVGNGSALGVEATYVTGIPVHDCSRQEQGSLDGDISLYQQTEGRVYVG